MATGLSVSSVRRRFGQSLLAALGDPRLGRLAGDFVLCLHDIPDRLRFRDLLHMLGETFRLCALADILSDGDPARSRAALTFDDGYGSWPVTLLPELSRAGVPATFFVCSGALDADTAGGEAFCRYCLGRTQTLPLLDGGLLREMSREPMWRIGGHGRTHADLARLDAAGLEREIGLDRDRLTNILADICGYAPEYFAYPFGQRRHLSRAAVRAVRQAGYRAAFTFIPGRLRPSDNRFRLPRVGLSCSMSPTEVRGRLRLAAIRSGPWD